MSLLDIIMRGGWLMIPIVLSSIVVVALGVSRWLTLRREGNELFLFVNQWESASNDESRYRAATKSGPGIVEDMATVFERESLDYRSEIESVGRANMEGYESGLGTLATLAAINPLMGFLGTVTGMIRAFMQIQNLGGNVNANVLAGGIWEALVTTAAGLAVGILALVIHNYLAVLTRRIATLVERIGEITIRQLGSGK